MWDSIIIIILILQILLIGYLVYLCLKKQRKIIQTIAYFGMIFIINFAIYLIALINEVKDRSMFDVFLCALNSLKTFIFDADVFDYNLSFASKYNMYFAIYGLGIFMGAAMTLFTAVDTFKYFFINKIRLHKYINCSCDILIGNLELSKKYIKNSPNSILWLDSVSDKEEINSLITEGYVVVNKELSAKNINQLLNKYKKYNLIYFNEENRKTVDVINVIEEYINMYNSSNIRFYLDILEYESSILLGNKFNNYINTFSKEELLIRKFVEENPLTKYLPNDFINKDTTLNKDKKINVLMIGFDNIQEELLKELILNNQFVTIKNDKYVNALVNYHLFDNIKNESELDKWLEKRFKELKKNQKEYFELPEEIADIRFNNIDLNSFELIEMVSNIITEKNSYNYIFVSKNSLDSYCFVNKILEEITSNNVHFYLNIDNISSKNENITLYGLNDEIINHDVIVNEKLNILAMHINGKYNSLEKEEYLNKWNELSLFTKKSNIYAALNLRFKLNLLGLNYKEGNNDEDLIKEIIGDINLTNEFKYYQNKNLITGLIANEHARWNAFHLLNGYRPMKKKDIIITKDKKVLKDNIKKEHACLTTYNGLNDLALFELRESLMFDNTLKIEDFDLYKYDLLLISVANSVLNELGLKVEKSK